MRSVRGIHFWKCRLKDRKYNRLYSTEKFILLAVLPLPDSETWWEQMRDLYLINCIEIQMLFITHK